MKDVKNVTAIVIDSGGSYVAMAIRLAKEYKKVYYCNPSWVDSYPLINKAWIGEGYDSIEVVDSPYSVYNEIDVWIFPDCYYGEFADFLCQQGENVWGSKNGEELELERDVLKYHMTSLGLPVQPFAVIKTFSELREYLKKHDDVFVKINKWRGTVETFHSQNYTLISPELDEIEYRLGALKDDIVFVVETPIYDAVEVGYDGWTVNGIYPDNCLSGIEIKDKAYAGIVKPYSSLSPLITDFNSKMVDTFKQYNYCGFFSTELRIKNKTAYMIDFTARTPCPPGDIYYPLIKNLGEVIYSGACGEMVQPVYTAIYACELLMESDWAVKNFQAVYFPEKYKDFISLKKSCIRDGIRCVIPQAYGSSDIGAVVGIGDTLEAATSQACEIADSIEGNGIHISKHCLNEAQAELDKFEAME